MIHVFTLLHSTHFLVVSIVAHNSNCMCYFLEIYLASGHCVEIDYAGHYQIGYSFST